MINLLLLLVRRLGSRKILRSNKGILLSRMVQSYLFSIGQFCDADLRFAFRKSSCFVRRSSGNDITKPRCVHAVALILAKKATSGEYESYALSWKPCQGDSLNLPDHRIHKDGDGDALFQLKSDSLPHAHAQTTKTYYKHRDSRIMKA
ncbi:hypothetical protein Tco_0098250 [Tanacetum coccineum]